MRQALSVLIVMTMVRPVMALTPGGLFPQFLWIVDHDYHATPYYRNAGYISYVKSFKGEAKENFYLSSLNILVQPPEIKGTTSVVSVGLPGTSVTYRFDAVPMVWFPPESLEKASFSWSADGQSLFVKRSLSERTSDKSITRIEFEYSGCLSSVFTKDVLKHLFTRYNSINPELFNFVAFPASGERRGGRRGGIIFGELREEPISGCTALDVSRNAPDANSNPLHPDYKPRRSGILPPLDYEPKVKNLSSEQRPELPKKYASLPPIKKERNMSAIQ
ncbi:hypothetical protein [Endozoicomonas sp. ISHI1]|uniref:hypothetical protein n=3 Tax=unclassified Endozoicomonas TaxID=2644528 RepID=UPI002148CBF3|nr:hypothetical protein [Endozoicomonas sp. ISHI1]